MTTALSTFHTDPFDFLEVLEKFTCFFEVVQQNLSAVDSEQTRFDNTYEDSLRRCNDFKDVFALVKRCVREYINHERGDLFLNWLTYR